MQAVELISLTVGAELCSPLYCIRKHGLSSIIFLHRCAMKTRPIPPYTCLIPRVPHRRSVEGTRKAAEEELRMSEKVKVFRKDAGLTIAVES